MRWRKYSVEITGHAWQRWIERAGRSPQTPRKLGRLLEKRLNDKIAPGLPVYPGMEIRLDLDGVEAVLVLSDKWICVTVVSSKTDEEGRRIDGL